MFGSVERKPQSHAQSGLALALPCRMTDRLASPASLAEAGGAPKVGHDKRRHWTSRSPPPLTAPTVPSVPSITRERRSLQA